MTHPDLPISTSPPIIKGNNIDGIKDDIGLMLNFAISTGKELPIDMNLGGTQDDGTLIDNYNKLRKIIEPSTVESIKYINSQMLKAADNKKWYKIPIFTKCVFIAGISLLTIICVSLSPDVDPENQAKGLLNSAGPVLLLNLIFICSAALLGVMFYLLKTFGDKIRNFTLVPADSIELNASILIGVISGFVVSELFAYSIDSINNDYIEIQKMTLALLGGFSSDAIFSILQGVVNKFKKLISA